MKFLFLSIPVLTISALAQVPSPLNATPPANMPPETVLANIDGKKLTFGDFQKLLGALAPQTQQNVLRDKRAFLQQYALMVRLNDLAEKENLDQQSPQKEMLLFQRMNSMAQFELNEVMNKIVVTPEDQKKFYASNEGRYKQVKLKVIYVPFVSNPPAQTDPKGKKYLTETEAKAKVEKLRKDILAGADFVKLVKEHSEDTTSAEKGGDFGTLRRSDNIPDAIREVVFSLKQGEVSEPVRQPNGYYLFRAEEVGVRPYDQAVKDEIYNEIKQARFKEWLDAMNTKAAASVKIENEEFFKGTAAPPPLPSPAKPAGK